MSERMMAPDEGTTHSQGALRITLVRSTIGRPKDQGRTVQSLGLRRLHQTVERPDNPSIRGMVTKIKHLLKVEEVDAVVAAEATTTDGGAAAPASRFARIVDAEVGGPR